ncbi:MAG: ACT domain-containing protein [Peptococcaceae bacterium]|nr:ACT domain-containing protein [Peptococcaceae bacterium]
MPKTGKDRFFLVQADILPESILKAVRAKEMLLKGEASTVNEAVARVNLSRSAYYKYRDRVFPLQAGIIGRDITINLTLEHRTGVLSGVLATIAAAGGNIITINQEMPSHGQARVGINLELAEITGDVEKLISDIKKIDGVKTVSLEKGIRRQGQGGGGI